MSDINAAPSSTESTASASVETKFYADGSSATGVGIPDVSPLDNRAPVVAKQEVGTAAPDPINATASAAAVGSSAQSSGSTSSDAPAVAQAGELQPSTSADSQSSSTGASVAPDAAASTPANATGSADASLNPTASGAALDGSEAGNGVAAGAAASSGSAATVSDANETGADAGNVGASDAGGQSANDIASSAQGASLGGDTAADALRAEIASLQQQLTDTHAEVAKWQGLYNAATAAKPHAQSLLQKLEAGEAIVMGDLQSRLRAFVEAL